ncbi:MAG: hemolysin, partial [Agathobacter sp.]|nr:hemolysin [Agathobacter sp.]
SIIQIGEYEYEVLGSTNLDDVSQELDADFSSDDYDTLGGLCLELLDHLPEVNEEMYTEDGVLLKIMEVDKNRIEKVYIRLPENGESDLED